MPLIVEDGTGLAAAESWISEADATAYWSDRGETAWTDADVAAREAALRVATDYLTFAYRWNGQPSTTVQRLPWPRAGVRSGRGWYPTDAIPAQVVSAQLVVAIEALKSNPLEKITPERQIIEESKSLKGISRTLKYSTPAVDEVSRLRRYPVVDSILAGIATVATNGSFASVPLRRVL